MWKTAFSACALILALGPLVRAQAPAGKILILENDRLMEGDIVQEGDVYRIRRGASEISIPIGKAKKLVSSTEAALAFLKTQAQLDSAAERMRLAKWCHANSLREHAIAETKAALEIQPSLSDAQFFLRYLQRSTPTANPAPAAVPIPQTPLAEVPQIDVSSDCLILFNNKVQPILLNACAGCHSSNYAGKFRLYQPNEGGSRVASQRNLSAAIAQIVLEKPSLSPLLIKSVSTHASSRAMEHPPLKNRQAEPYRILQMWVDMVAVGNPHLRELRITAAATAPASAERPASVTQPPIPASFESRAKDPPRVVNFAELSPLPLQASAPSPTTKQTVLPAPSMNAKSTASSEGPSTPPTASAAIQEASDEFDPLWFNQKYHTKK